MKNTPNCKSILFISPFFFPEEISTGKYNTCLVKALKNRDCHVNVIASHPLYPDWVPKKSHEGLDGVEISRGGLFTRYPNSQVIRRLVLEVWFSFHVMKNIFKYRNNIDLIVAVFPPVLFMTLSYCFLPKRIQKIGIIHDLQGLMAKSNKKISRSVISSIIKLIEVSAYKKCDKLICLSKSMQRVLVNNYRINKYKTAVFYPFMSINENSLDVKTDILMNIFDKKFKHIVYSGALGEKQKPDDLLSFFIRLCEEDCDIMCHIISRGPVFDQLRGAFQKQFSSRICFHDLVPEEFLVELYGRSTVHVIPQAKGTGAGAFPSKLPNLLSQGVPVFAMCDEESELADLVNRVSFGKVSSAWDEEEMVSDMERFLKQINGVSRSKYKDEYKEKMEILFSVDSLVDEMLHGCN